MPNFRFAPPAVLLFVFSLAVHFLSGCSGSASSSTLVPPPNTSTYYVSGTGSDSADGLTSSTAFLTLQHAANLTHPGDTVLVLNGTYTNADPTGSVLDISTPGNASQWITFMAAPGQTPVISFNGWAGVSFEPTAAYVEVKGFTVTGNNQNVTLQAALAQSTTNPSPLFNGSCFSADGRSGTPTQKPNHLKILNNIVSECGCSGISAIESDYVTISGNTVFDSAWYTIYGCSAISTLNDWNSDDSTEYKIFISANKLYRNQEYIPWIDAGQITDGEAIIVDTNRNDQSGSTLTAYTGRTLIVNNVIFNNGSAAIEVFDSDHVDVVNNSTFGNVLSTPVSGRGEMSINEANDVNVVNNIFYSSSGQNPIAILSSCPSCMIDYNLYFGGSNSPASSPGAHDLIADPLYLNPAPSMLPLVNLQVSSSSPAVGSGTSYLAPTVDFAGNPRPSGNGYDRGAYQQQ